MKRFIVCIVASAAALASNTAWTEVLQPYQNYSVHLGGLDGSVYTEATRTGQRLVATLGGGPDRTPVRFVTDLAVGQSATVSVPRGPGEPALEVTFTLQGRHVVVTDDHLLVGSMR